MRILITGICGFAGSAIAESLLERRAGLRIEGIDNLLRPGSEMNRERLRRMGVGFTHGDIRMASDVASLAPADWVIDAAAIPSVLAGVQSAFGSRAVMEHNVSGTINILEYAKAHKAGILLLSSSRVYSIPALRSIPLTDCGTRFGLDLSAALPAGVFAEGIGPEFSTAAPISLYGATKLACETLALEYGEAFQLPVWITRCGVLAGAGQFGTPDQGIFAYWINAHLRRRPLRYLGFGGSGKQVRDVFHPRDLAALLLSQTDEQRRGGQRIYTAGGGAAGALSLADLTAWCDARFGAHSPSVDGTERPYDVPWIAMDSAAALSDFGWHREIPAPRILEEIAAHAEAHPDWLERSGA